MNYTKGEWKVYQDGMAQRTSVVSEDGIGFFRANIADLDRKNKEYVANAHLIAAAPNMYEALKTIAPNIRFMYEGHRDDAGLRYKYELLEQALAKAEGK